LLLLVSCAQLAAGAPRVGAQPKYFNLAAPVTIEWPDQPWEGDQQPHTLSVVELNRDGFRYWGWYGLNHGRGMGLARSDDLLHWTKFEGNPLWLNARWPSVLQGQSPANSNTLYFAVTRDYDTPSSRIALATSRDGKQLMEVKTLVRAIANQRNQNPNLYWDAPSKRYVLTFYRGNDTDYFDVVMRSAESPEQLDVAAEAILLHSTQTVAAPTLLRVPHAGATHQPLYYLATEIYPNRYDKSKDGDWQVKVFASPHLTGPYLPVAGNPIQQGDRACLFQHIFGGRYYGFQSHLDRATDRWSMEVLVAPLPQ